MDTILIEKADLIEHFDLEKYESKMLEDDEKKYLIDKLMDFMVKCNLRLNKIEINLENIFNIIYLYIKDKYLFNLFENKFYEYDLTYVDLDNKNNEIIFYLVIRKYYDKFGFRLETINNNNFLLCIKHFNSIMNYFYKKSKLIFFGLN